MKTLWNTFRRRWFLAVSLSLMFGAVGAWFLIPAPSTATTEAYIAEAGLKEQSKLIQRRGKLRKLRDLEQKQREAVTATEVAARSIAERVGAADPEAVSALQRMNLEIHNSRINDLTSITTRLELAEQAKQASPAEDLDSEIARLTRLKETYEKLIAEYEAGKKQDAVDICNLDVLRSEFAFRRTLLQFLREEIAQLENE